MLRFIANRLIQEHGKILWIDLDPGQAEFTLPGLSLLQSIYYATFVKPLFRNNRFMLDEMT